MLAIGSPKTGKLHNASRKGMGVEIRYGGD
jgi:hypothetical protein